MSEKERIAFEPSWDSLRQFRIPEWYKDAKFGIFIHWGLYSVPAYDNEWYSRNMYLQGDVAYEHHQKTYGDKFGYKDFIPMFTAEHWNPHEWATLIKSAGARYVIFVAEHHDGFMLYDSELSRWNAAKMGPKRDIVDELSEAIRAEGITFGISNHRAEHWWFMNGGREFESDVQDPEYADFYGPAMPSPRKYYSDGWDSKDWQPRPDEVFLDDWLARCCEIVDKHRPSIFYFDWWIQQEVFEPYLQKFAAYYYNKAAEWGIDAAINCKNRAYPEGTAVFDVERGNLTHIHPELWQTDTSVSNNSWCYIENHDYKTSVEILHNLIDVVSKNGTLLLNIGPKADGTIPQPEQAMLREIGQWLADNGEAIYGTRPWKISGEGPTERQEGEFTEKNRQSFTAEDVRFTTRGDILYAIVLGKTQDVLIKSLSTEKDLYPHHIKRVTHLATGKEIAWSRDADGLHCQIVSDENAVVLKIEHD